MDIIISKPINKQVGLKIEAIALIGFLMILLFLIATSFVFKTGYDWLHYYRPAISMLFSGQNPFSVNGYFNAPWALVLLSPLYFFSDRLAIALLGATNIAVFAFVAHRLGARPFVTAAFALSPFVLFGSVNPNLDWLIALGFILPPQIGLFFVLLKPQVGFVIALFWLVDSFRQGGYKNTLRVFAPVSIAFLISFVLYGFWPLNFSTLPDVYWNFSLFPDSIPIGLVMMVSAILKNKKGHAILAAPFLSPYVAAPSWPVAVLGLLPDNATTLAAVIGMWLISFRLDLIL